MQPALRQSRVLSLRRMCRKRRYPETWRCVILNEVKNLYR